MPLSIVNQDGMPINGLYGYLLFIAKLLKVSKAEHLVFAFDESLNSCFRNTIYEGYKASRGMPDEELAFQLKACKKLTESLGLSCVSSKRYEADDFLGSFSKGLRSEFSRAIFVTRDKDIGQLLRENDFLWDFASNERTDRHVFKQKFGVAPVQFPDYLALVGDPVDDIPGVSGVGAVAAQHLISRFRSLESLYDHLNAGLDIELRGGKRISQSLIDQESMARLSKKLATIKCDIKLNKSIETLRWSPVSAKQFSASLRRAGVTGRSYAAINNAFNDLLESD